MTDIFSASGSDLRFASDGTRTPRCQNRRHVRKPRHPAPPSPLADALAQVGDRWTLLAVAALLDGPKRFNELQEEMHGIAPNVPSARLKSLAGHALVVTRPYSDRPPRFVYELSDSGRQLGGPLRLLADWGARRDGGGAPLGGGRAQPAHHGRHGARGALVVPDLRADGGRPRRRGRGHPHLDG